MGKFDQPSSESTIDFNSQASEVSEVEDGLNYEDLPSINTAVETAVENPASKAMEALEKWQSEISDLKTDLNKGLVTKDGARLEMDSLLADLKVVRQRWESQVPQETIQKLETLIIELKDLRKSVASRMEKARKWLAAPLMGLGILGAGKANDHYQDFSAAEAQAAELAQLGGEFTPPPVPDSFLVMPEKAELPSTKDLFRQFERYVKEHEAKGLDLSVEESKPGLLGVYLKFGRQIDRSIKFSDKFLPELAKRLDIPENQLRIMQEIFHESIYEQPPVMGGGGGTSSVFYTSENILKFNGHEDFYKEQLNASVELGKHIIPQIETAPETIKPELKKSFANFLRAELAVRAFDERIKNAINKKIDFELEGFEGAYNDSRPSIFAQQAVYLEKRANAIKEWYSVLSTIQPNASVEKNLAQLAVNLQGWAGKRATALNVSAKESEQGMLLGGDPAEWNKFVIEGDAEYRKNAEALETLLAEYQSDAPMIASK